MSDLFEVSWRYGTDYNSIPKIGDSFSVLVPTNQEHKVEIAKKDQKKKRKLKIL